MSVLFCRIAVLLSVSSNLSFSQLLQFERAKCGRVMIVTGFISADQGAHDLQAELARLESLVQPTPALLVLQAVSEKIGLEAFGSSYLSHSSEIEDVRKQRQRFAQIKVAIAVRSANQVRVGVAYRGRNEWVGSPIEILPGLRVIHAQCGAPRSGSLNLFVQDSGIGIDEATRYYRAISELLQVDVEKLSVSFSMDGSFFPDDNFSQQNPLMPDFVSMSKGPVARGTIICSPYGSSACRVYDVPAR